MQPGQGVAAATAAENGDSGPSVDCCVCCWCDGELWPWYSDE